MEPKAFDSFQETPIQFIGQELGNLLFVKREDLIPFSFGGNKARKAAYFFDEFDRNGYGSVVTYGSSSSNHCRVVANHCASRGIPCHIVSPEEASVPTFNSFLMKAFGAEIKTVPVDCVRDAIEGEIGHLERDGLRPFFIAGGGHGNLGTQAYVDCYREIASFQERIGVCFDLVFHASGTGTTQAGLICGKILNTGRESIVGISIARRNPQGRNIVVESVRDYLGSKGVEVSLSRIESSVEFIDEYIGGGYGSSPDGAQKAQEELFIRHGIPSDRTYVAKAYHGMREYLKANIVTGKNILFIHTGGTPLLFDDLAQQRAE